MKQQTCFFIMPFRPELHFMWLFLKAHIEKNHSVLCLRGDSAYQTIPLHEKLLGMIVGADFVVADITGRNPNVMYELGVADNLGKRVIALHQKTEGIDKIPSDIKYKEFLLYTLDDHLNLLAQLDGAIDNLLNRNYDALYSAARDVLHMFNQDQGQSLTPADKEHFVQAVRLAEKTRGVPSSEDQFAFRGFLLPKIIEDNRPEIMEKILDWLKKK